MAVLIDRVPGKPGRVLVTPEDGGEAFYATLELADEPVVAGNKVNRQNVIDTARQGVISSWSKPQFFVFEKSCVWTVPNGILNDEIIIAGCGGPPADTVGSGAGIFFERCRISAGTELTFVIGAAGGQTLVYCSNNSGVKIVADSGVDGYGASAGAAVIPENWLGDNGAHISGMVGGGGGAGGKNKEPKTVLSSSSTQTVIDNTIKNNPNNGGHGGNGGLFGGGGGGGAGAGKSGTPGKAGLYGGRGDAAGATTIATAGASLPYIFPELLFALDFVPNKGGSPDFKSPSATQDYGYGNGGGGTFEGAGGTGYSSSSSSGAGGGGMGATGGKAGNRGGSGGGGFGAGGTGGTGNNGGGGGGGLGAGGGGISGIGKKDVAGGAGGDGVILLVYKRRGMVL